MNTRDMQIFIKIADYKSITRTAEDIQMTQPAVSSALKRLEEEVGYDLFIRRGKWLILNEQGKIFYSAAKQFLDEMSHVHEGLRVEAHHKEEMIIKLCTHSDRLYSLLGDFAWENPDIRVIFRKGAITEEDDFRFSDFTVTKSQDRKEEWDSIPLEHRGALYAIIHKNHRLAQKMQLTMQDLKDEKFVFLRAKSNTGLEDTYKICMNAGIRPDIALVAYNNSSKYSAVRRGIGIAVTFDNELSLAPLIKDCKIIPINLSLTLEWICLNWNQSELSNAGKRFLEYVKKKV